MRNWNGEMRNRRTASVQKMPGGFTDAKAAGNRSAVMASQEQMRNRRTASVQKMPRGFTDAKAAGNRSAVMAS
jgi:hypothetical protein